ncbi:hypothetical protein CERSUDRAFT_125904 [Gelatoporia subvermispora B]|uniref:Carboxylesterase type B domain-containing protein n=1 Tax=Ceriporiopsis subvermispora (strain B) TaxID=914234 RepID=M2R3X2_CERS8|nr:hypothetical protein CERSUDRAFT_125904 [Gelatoporia subvermispora B]
MLALAFLVSCTLFSTTLAASAPAPPSVTLDSAVFTGIRVNNTDRYLGVPFAQPPVGDLRFALPQTLAKFEGAHDATTYGSVCPQDLAVVIGSGGSDFLEPFQAAFTAVFPSPVGVNQSEDCLYLDVYAPAGTKQGANLPVVVWLGFGSFLWGGSPFYDGNVIVERSVQDHEPVILVIINWRLNAFGFLPGQQAKDAGITNLGLRDQRQALQWMQQYIGQFGGDRGRVTLWGANTGSISVALQMLNNGGNTEGLFNSAWMHSGFPVPLNTYSDLQGTYDILVNQTSCLNSTATDSLECLRELPFDELYLAMLAAPAQERFGRWQVVLDNDFIAEQPETLLQQGKVARVPFVVGCTQDEGTDEALNLTSIITDDDVATWLMEEGLPGVPMSAVEQILALYPSDPADGSPFDTGDLYAITPQYKRLSAIVGDLEYHGQRRFFLNNTADQQLAWSYQSNEFKFPFVGAIDLSDLLNIWAPGDLTDRLIFFVANGNPNNGSGLVWPQWTVQVPNQLNIANDSSFTIEPDTFRTEGINLLMSLNIQFPE